MNTPDVVVIGAGIGGLTAAALLARQGHRVVVCEQHTLAGGACTSWTRTARTADKGAFVFDAGVHDISGAHGDGVVAALLHHLGVADRVEWLEVDHDWRLPGVSWRPPRGHAAVLADLSARFPADATGLERFFDEVAAIRSEMGPLPLPGRSGPGLPPGGARGGVLRRWAGVSFERMLHGFVKDAGLRALLSVLSVYLTHDPRTVSAVQMAGVIGAYLLEGGRRPRGGSQVLADALVAAIADHGGDVRLGCGVAGVVVDSEASVRGVRLDDGSVLQTRQVIANACARRTLLELVGIAALPAALHKKAEDLRPSTSAFVAFLGLDRCPALPAITMVDNGRRQFCIANPSAVDDRVAPHGGASVAVVTLVPPAEAATWQRASPGYAARKRAAGEALIDDAAEVIDGLRAQLVFRELATPATFGRYTQASGGAIYGLATGDLLLPTTAIAGLTLCGGGVFPGAGVEAVVRSGSLAARCVDGSAVVRTAADMRPLEGAR